MKTTEQELKVYDLTPSSPHLVTNAYFDPEKFEVYAVSDTGSGVPADAYHSRHLWLGSIPSDAANAGPFEEFLREPETVRVLRTIAAGHETSWDGNNHVGKLSDDAEGLLLWAQEVWQEASESVPTYWDPWEWFQPVEDEILSELIEKGFERWAEDERAAALAEGAILSADDLRGWAEDKLEEALEEADSRVTRERIQEVLDGVR